MIGASKILTVSYGTFSCTLEGFDEPFNTMKAIAEYFRDLAADDRYFGAEPPTPDAAMLHRIAEREVNRHVEARVQDNTVILRAGQPVAPAAPAPHPAAAPTPLVADESVAAKLQRIRAAVARASAPVEDAVYVEDQHAEPAPAPVAPAAVAGAHLAGDTAFDDSHITALREDWEALDAAPEVADLADTEEDLREVFAQAPTEPEVLVLSETILPEAAPDPLDDLPEATPEEDEALITSLRLVPNRPAPDLAEAEEDEDLDGLLASLAREPEALPDTLPEDEPFDDDAFAAATASPALPDWEEDLTPAPDWAASAEAEATEVFEDPVPEAAEAAPDTWPVDPELPAPAIDKLRRARERVLLARRPVDAATDVEDEDDGALRAENRERLQATVKENDDLNRLLRQTNSEMEVPENRRRMSTLAHLKAAVAATVADLRSPGAAAQAGEASRLDRYRADLARVVRPRRPGGTESGDRPAPLVLVSEQRIDQPAADAGQSRVLPRRVSTGSLALEDQDEDVVDAPVDPENIFASSKSFAEFAERLGAMELPDLLEAAAAYTSCVEGRPHFSRPHLMRHVAAVTEDSEGVRESSMRSFGTLLRQGKIAKVKRGQFAITDSSYYLAEARRMQN